ncbi:hypothetical protein P8C59_007758 [Phyllachora maydis]|uniref:Uncharacterized protein n=1 Tax=Phyllachora maydis TaxID=1825666 RepID=A0AAD9MHC9_9PEZI|nr:hypothetical protein P8C59_007758 [Phyllachora maydis]
MADILEESRNPAIEAYRAAHIANSSNLTSNSNSNPSKKGKNKKKGKKKASYNVKGQNYSTKSAEQASFILGSYNLAIEKEEESDSSSNSSYSFLTYLTTTTATTTTTTSTANPTTTITATRSSDISFNSPFKGLSSS